MRGGIEVFKRSIIILLVFCFIYSFKLRAQPVPSGRRLRDIVAAGYPDSSIIIGGTTGAWLLSSTTGKILDREFSYVTPENDFKQWAIHPDNSSWSWSQSDVWVEHIDSNDQVLRMHCPIGPQCSNWAQNDSRTPEELDTNMCVFLDSLCKRYNGTPGFEYMDVVNETVVNGNWHENKDGTGWECPWYKMGLDTHDVPIYIIKAFEICDLLAPDIKLIYNHHEHPENTASWDLIKRTVLYLKDTLNLRVDGIGWQAHVDVGWESESRLNDLRNLIDWAQSNNLEFHVTEAGVWLTDNTQEDFEAQAVTYRAILDVLLEKRSTGNVGWNTWHIDDGHGWRTSEYPSLFDVNYEAKPAYYAIQAALEGEAGIEDLLEDKSIAFKLYNSPNPFISRTSINFEIPGRSYVDLKIHDVSGRELKTVFSGEMEGGSHSVEWNAKNLSAGIYFCLMKVEDIVLKNQMILVK
jgi:endo-1,4-beta-xylanase